MKTSQVGATRMPTFTASGDHWVFESEIFWKARGERVSLRQSQSRVFSKRFLRQMPDGRPQVQKVERNTASQYYKFSSTPRNKYAGKPLEMHQNPSIYYLTATALQAANATPQVSAAYND
jgi:hypothetical protein